MGGLVNIYLVKSTATQKRYVGQTVRTLPERWVQHTYEARTGKGYALHRAMRFHGINTFSIHLIEVCDESVADERESLWIDAYKTFGPCGYNLCLGGQGPRGAKRSPDVVERIAAKHRGKKLSPEHCARISAMHKGRKHSPEHIEKVARAHRGQRRPQEWKDAQAAAHLGISLEEYQAQRAAGFMNCKSRKGKPWHWVPEAQITGRRICRGCLREMYLIRTYGSPDHPGVRNHPGFRRPNRGTSADARAA